MPDDLTLLKSGIYNLGFLALSRGTDATELLDWWWSWLETDCWRNPAKGVFTDQKWMNFTPLFWPRSAILRDTTYNVAYWNLTQRELSQDGDQWRVDGRPLTFFHFSGLDPLFPDALSKHQTRLDVNARTPLAKILADYAELILAEGHRELAAIPPANIVFDNGIAVDPIARHAYQQATADGESFGRPLETGPGSFFSWLCKPLPYDTRGASAIRMTAYLATIYELRPDLRRAFPDVYGSDRTGFMNWVRDGATRDLGADSRMLALQLPSSPPPVRLAGYLRAALGVGEAARGYVKSMQAEGIEVHLVDASEMTASPLSDNSLDLIAGSHEDVSHWVNVIHVNADELPNFREHAGESFFAGNYNVGIWAWETQTFPSEWHDRFDMLDEIWVGSSFMAEAISKVSPIPVVCIPHVIDVPLVEGRRDEFGLSDEEFVFLFNFDFDSRSSRKNPMGTLAAFRRAFGPDEPVRLMLKSLNGHKRPEELAALKEAAEGLRVTILDEALDSDARYRLLDCCDCFVSLHRAEGFGLGLAEAMAFGKPVIATGWSGNMDFMTVSNSFPVRYTLEPLEQADPPYAAGTIWAVPDLDHAARLMQSVRREPDATAEVGRRARLDIRAGFSASVVGAQVRHRLQMIHDRHAPVAVASPVAGLKARMGWAVLRLLRSAWQTTLRLTPSRLHPRLRRLSTRIRRLLPDATPVVAPPVAGLKARMGRAVFRLLRSTLQTTLRLTPSRFHPRLRRLSTRIRRLLPTA